MLTVIVRRFHLPKRPTSAIRLPLISLAASSSRMDPTKQTSESMRDTTSSHAEKGLLSAKEVLKIGVNYGKLSNHLNQIKYVHDLLEVIRDKLPDQPDLEPTIDDITKDVKLLSPLLDNKNEISIVSRLKRLWIDKKAKDILKRLEEAQQNLNAVRGLRFPMGY